jgi:hypothetical protein
MVDISCSEQVGLLCLTPVCAVFRNIITVKRDKETHERANSNNPTLVLIVLCSIVI